MNTKAFLRDWKPGDIVTAADMQALADTVAMLESAGHTGGASPGGRSRRVTDGPQGWPWQVLALHGEDRYELRVVRGKVLAGMRMTGYGEGLGEEEVAYTYLELPETEGADVVQDYDGTQPVATVYLELTGRVVRRYLTWGDMEDAGLPMNSYGGLTEADRATQTGHEVVTLEDAALRVTCAPVDTALRIWPLAVVNKEHKQPVTQLQWGDLSAFECRGVAVDVAGGDVLWPTPWENGAEWGTTAHAQGMACVTQIEFSTDVESIEGELYGCMDADGALEFYLGQYTEPGETDDPPNDDPPNDDPPWEEEEEDDDDIPPGPYDPPGDDDSITRVRYGYIAGEGFLSCELVRAGNKKLYWKLELDPDYLSKLCENLPCPATVTVQGDGVQVGVHSEVEMGLGTVSVTVTATGMMLRGMVALEFGGLDGDDVSTKKVTRKVTYKGNPVWSQPRTWYLTPRKVHQAGRYVMLDKAVRGYDPGGFVKARQWYRFRVNKATFTRAARNEFKKALGAIKVQDNEVATSSDSCVVGTLTGTAIAPVFDFRLQDA